MSYSKEWASRGDGQSRLGINPMKDLKSRSIYLCIVGRDYARNVFFIAVDAEPTGERLKRLSWGESYPSSGYAEYAEYLYVNAQGEKQVTHPCTEYTREELNPRISVQWYRIIDAPFEPTIKVRRELTYKQMMTLRKSMPRFRVEFDPRPITFKPVLGPDPSPVLYDITFTSRNFDEQEVATRIFTEIAGPLF